jgi:transcriptional regulator GlxA family with amidase domain
VQEVNRPTFGGGYVVERLLELLCADAIRSHVETIPEHTVGWFRGFRDPVVGRAIAMIHSRPGENWSVKSLAQCVSISPSRFAARFTATLGESPMAYVTKWRMYVASGLLGNSQQSIDQISTSVGYESLAAFSRTFKRYLGLPPAAWRTNRRA